MQWIFDEEEESSVRYELELATEAGVRASFEFERWWYAIVEASYQLTFTHERIELAYFSGDVHPTWSGAFFAAAFAAEKLRWMHCPIFWATPVRCCISSGGTSSQ